nr:Fe(3+)-hydroxamate ABC transporter permease FhuB [Pseudomonas sp. 37 R 15]
MSTDPVDCAAPDIFAGSGHTVLRRYLLSLSLLAVLVLLYLQISTPLGLSQQLAQALAPSDDSLDNLTFSLAVLPRLLMALLVGTAMGLSGSLLQQLTQNRLVSPMTIGVSSGAWLGLLCLSAVAPALVASHGEWAALCGAVLAVGVVLLIAGRDGIAGLPMVLAGMAMNLLLGAVAAAILLIDHQQNRGVSVWGAGDLGQIDWYFVSWLWPKLAVGALLIMFAPRPLALLQLGSRAARGRGLNLWPVLLVLFLSALWLSAVAITAVGLIGFIGLIAPNLARLLGARTPRDELLYSSLLGMLVLLGSDTLALLLTNSLGDLVPTGATAALIGAPVLLWLSRRQLAANDMRSLSLVGTSARGLAVRLRWTLPLMVGLTLLLSLCVNRSLDGWLLEWPSSLVWSLRWPRVLTAVAAGSGLAVAGLLLQRLLRNPLASPDILGITAGAALAVMLILLVAGNNLFWLKAPLAAFSGSMIVLGLLLVLGRRHDYAPGVMVLVGIALGALLNTGLQFCLVKASIDSLALLGWLAGSTYRVSAGQSVGLAVSVALLSALSLLFHRALTLISMDDGIARSRGLEVRRVRLVLLVLAALLCALVTSLLGPVGFVGLLAPHMAALFGARRVVAQWWLAAVLGGLLMLIADWLGRTVIFPLQVPVGIVASVLCGLYFVYLLVRQRLP